MRNSFVPNLTVVQADMAHLSSDGIFRRVQYSPVRAE
jgi:hypothetical protein